MYGAILGALAGLADAGSQIGNFFHNNNVYRMQNAYNSPAAQVARLQSAGINPQAVVDKIAAQNSGEFNKADFDFGKSFQTASSVSSGFGSYEKLGHEIEGISLDNMYKKATLKDRVNDVSQLVYKHYLEGQLLKGRITEQDYVNLLKDFEVEWQKYLSGQSSIYDPVVEYFSEDGVDHVISHYSPRALSERYERGSDRVDYEYKRDTASARTQYESEKLQKVIADTSLANLQAARAAVALKYEQTTGSPFNSRDPWTNFFLNVIRKLGTWSQTHPGVSLSPKELFNLILSIDL